MKRDVEIGDGKTITLECNGATPYLIKSVFGVDILSVLGKISEKETSEVMEVAQKMAFIMNLQAEHGWREVKDAQFDAYIDWLEGIDFSAMTDSVVVGALELWNNSSKPSSTPKN